MTDEIWICICTYKRPTLMDTLRSLSLLKPLKGYEVKVLIADNDVEPSASRMVEQARQLFGLDIKYVHAPKHNISTARNACLDNVEGPLVVFIDDDEIVAPDWLHVLVETMRVEDLDIVFGPVWAIYPEDCPTWIKNLDAHSKVLFGDRLETGYTANVLMNMERDAIKGRRFNLERGGTGGEDTEFFYECSQDGAKLGYTEKATIWEHVTQARLNWKWMSRAKFRSGITFGLVKRKHLNLFDSFALSGASMLKVSACMLGAALLLPFRQKSLGYYLRAIFHYGVLASGFNAKEEVMYGRVQQSG